MLDRPELGQMVLEESLPDFLKAICLRDAPLIKEMQCNCEKMDPNFEGYLTECSILALDGDGQIVFIFVFT